MEPEADDEDNAGGGGCVILILAIGIGFFALWMTKLDNLHQERMAQIACNQQGSLNSKTGGNNGGIK